VRTVATVLLVWLALSVPVALLVGKWLARKDRQATQASPDLLEQQGRQDRQATQAPRAIPDPRARRDHKAHQAHPDRRRPN